MGLICEIPKIEELVNLIRDEIFPNVFSKIDNLDFHHKKIVFLIHQIVTKDKEKVKEILLKIDNLKQVLNEDAKFFYESDPSCSLVEEVILIYPGFLAILYYRIANIFYRLDFKIISRVISELAHSKTGIDIHPGASIGHPFFIDHGTGVVIGETSIIGNNVKIYHGVTLGALSLSKGRELVNKKRHPTIKNNVTIYSNASIFGGETIIGNNVIIGSSLTISSSIEDDMIVQCENDNYKTIFKKR